MYQYYPRTTHWQHLTWHSNTLTVSSSMKTFINYWTELIVFNWQDCQSNIDIHEQQCTTEVILHCLFLLWIIVIFNCNRFLYDIKMLNGNCLNHPWQTWVQVNIFNRSTWQNHGVTTEWQDFLISCFFCLLSCWCERCCVDELSVDVIDQYLSP